MNRTRLLDVSRPRAGRMSTAYADAVVALRWWVVAGWAAVAFGASLWLPGIDDSGSGVEGFVPLDTPAVQAELRSFQAFGFPLSSRTALVQRDPDGLSVYTHVEAVLRAAALSQGQYDDAGPLLGALPLTNSFGAFPGAKERDTTVVTYLFTAPTVGFATQLEAGEAFARSRLEPEDHYVGVTGSVPARAEQARLVEESLPLVELATLLAIVLIVAANFRSLIAPLVTLVTAGTALVITLQVGGVLGGLIDISIPSDIEPLLVALQLGVVTDYVIFFLSAFHRQLRRGELPADAARSATAEYAPIVAVAGLTVAAGTAALLVARSDLFRAFGPGMAMAILIGLVVAITLVPALMAILGSWVFWPKPPRSAEDVVAADGAPLPDMPGPGPASLAGPGLQRRTVAVMTRRRNAAVIASSCIAVLALATVPLTHVGLGLAFVPSLPEDNAVAAAAQQAKSGFSEGILSPTTVLVEGDRVTSQRAALARMERALEAVDGVAAVVGPGDQLLPVELGIFLSRDGGAARYLVVLDDEPLGATAVDTLRGIREQMPRLTRDAGLADATVSLAGDTAIAETVVSSTRADLGRIALAALVVNLLLLALFLRALVAPLYLLASSVLALGATLGLTTLLFQDVLGYDGLTFYVPFAAATLLIALGSDYNIFGVGHIWAAARHQSLRAALIEAIPDTTRAITAAGFTLAVSFGLLALVPLRPFYELAFAMFVGILLDAIVIRSLLVPALITLVGRRSGWPGRQLHAPAGVTDDSDAA